MAISRQPKAVRSATNGYTKKPKVAGWASEGYITIPHGSRVAT